jgi:hypothetical protein
VLLFKVNQRPLPQPTMWESDRRSVADVLPFGEPVTTGRRYRRTWYLGDREVREDMVADILGDREADILIGHIGWQRRGGQQTAHFDRERRTWVDAVAQGPTGNHAPFLYDRATSRLAVLRHPSFSPATVAHVFTELLNRGEKADSARPRAVEWDVAPLLDVPSFRAWLSRTRAVRRVTFVARLPNPDVLEEFAVVLRRLEERRAAALREEWTARDPDEGLQNIEEDPDARQIIAAAEKGYGYVTGQGKTAEGTETRFNQRETVRRETTPPLPSSWTEMMDVFVQFALHRMRRRDRE